MDLNADLLRRIGPLIPPDPDRMAVAETGYLIVILSSKVKMPLNDENAASVV